MGKFKRKLKQVGDADIDNMSLEQLRDYVKQQITLKAKETVNKAVDKIVDIASNDDDFDNLVMEPKAKYNSSK